MPLDMCTRSSRPTTPDTLPAMADGKRAADVAPHPVRPFEKRKSANPVPNALSTLAASPWKVTRILLDDTLG